MAASNRLCIALALSAAVLAPSFVSAQDEDAFDRTPVDCVIVSGIDRTRVIDDQTILFYMRGRKVYRNYLPRDCPRLEHEGRFSYRVTAGRLCDIDTVTVLEQWGGQLNRGFTCPLGAFHPIPREEADELVRMAKEGGGVRETMDVKPVELPEDTTDDAPTEPAGDPPD